MRDWATGIVEDPTVQARFLADARAGTLHSSVLAVLLAYAYGKPRGTTSAEPMIALSEIEEARQSLRAKLQHITDSSSGGTRWPVAYLRARPYCGAVNPWFAAKLIQRMASTSSIETPSPAA